MIRMKYLGLIASILVLAAWKPILKTSATEADDKQAKLFAPDPERAVVYVFRDNAFLGRSLKCQLVVNKVSITDNDCDRFVVISLAAGEYELLSLSSKESTAVSSLVHNKRKTPVHLTAEAGKLYYFQEVFSPGGGFSLKAVPAEEAQAAIRKEKLLSLNRL